MLRILALPLGFVLDLILWRSILDQTSGMLDR